MENLTPRQPDTVLQPFLQAKGEAESRRHLERLLNEAEPVILGILRRRWRVSPNAGRAGTQSQDGQIAEDVRSEVVLNLITRLNELKARSGEGAISNFRGFIATTTYHVCDNYLRKKYPQRASLKDKLYYLLAKKTSQSGFALWEGGDGERLCGFDLWRAQGKPLRRSERYEQLLTAPQRFVEAALPNEDLARLNPGDLLAAIFNWVGGPVALDDLVRVVGELWGVRDQPFVEPELRDEEETDVLGGIEDTRVNVAGEVIQRSYLEWLWDEIRQLPPRQCAALLLNLKDDAGRGVIELLPITGIAGPRQIAEALALPAERFAALWNDLPIEDAAIAELLGCTRQQVINLRKVARERLARRAKSFEAV